MKLTAPIIALGFCYAILFGYVALSYGDLPAKVATHFGIDGQPNGWMSRNGIVAFTVSLGIFLPAFIVWRMATTGRIPVSFVKLPNRDYWLALERRKATLAILFQHSLWLACMCVLFFTGVHWLIVQANPPHGQIHLSLIDLALVTGGFLLGTGVWVIFLRRKFFKIG